MKVILANPRGFCAGVDRAIEIVNRALELFGVPVFVRHEVVHNRYVVEDLKSRGAIFIEDLADVPDGATLIFSAHGVPRAVQEAAAARDLRVFDATCPLVTKVHMEVVRHARAGRECILIGHAGHPEVEGTLGQYDERHGGRMYLVEDLAGVAALSVRNEQELAYVTQTTLSVDDAARIVDALRRKFPAIQGPRKDDICYATQNRQDAVRALAGQCDLILVVGSKNSSNSNRLRELAEQNGVPAHLIDTADQIQAEWLTDKQVIGVTAGASAPELLVRQVIEALASRGALFAEEQHGREENVTFAMPRALRNEA